MTDYFVVAPFHVMILNNIHNFTLMVYGFNFSSDSNETQDHKTQDYFSLKENKPIKIQI